MRISTDAKQLNIELVALTNVDVSTLSPATEYGKDTPQLVDGAPVYRLPDVVVKVDGHIDRNTTVKVRNLPADAVQELSVLHLAGRVVITPYISDADKRIHYSVLADALA